VKKFKKVLALSLALAMGLSLAACGDSSSSSSSDSNSGDDDANVDNSGDDTNGGDEDASGDATLDFGEQGSVFNIYCWNDEFASRLTAFMPGYTADDADNPTNGGTMEDGTRVNFIVTPSDDNAYQDKLDSTLPGNADASADDKVDLFLIEADYALKYVNSDYTMNVADLGITDADTADMYQYTKDICTASDGSLKAVSWQATPGLFAYRRDIATEVLGTDDPDEVQEYVKDWDTFKDTAAKMKDAGYTMLAGYDDSYRVYSNNVSNPWVTDGVLTIDPKIEQWIEDTKEFKDAGYLNEGCGLWSDGWAKEQGPDGHTFGFFYSTWGINFTLAGYSLADSDAAQEVGNGLYGQYAVCQGPDAFYWGGTWICGATGTDNEQLVHDIMYSMTCDKDIALAITEETQDYTNNQPAMEELAQDFSSDFLGGQNHIALFVDAAKEIDMSNTCPYDQGCNEEIQTAFKDYFDGTVDYDTALANFKQAITTKYPELTVAD
jgi:hypothetical protein